jgi:type IX secretion system PorP/SprF family membrane protein
MAPYKKIVFFIILLIATHSSMGQDASFAQFFSNQLYLNPAYAGNPKFQRFALVYRNQWLTRQSPYMLYGVSFDRFYEDYNSGLGINLMNDMQALGTINWLTLDLLYSYNIQLAYNAQIRGGLQVGGILKSQSTRNVVFPDMIDPSGEVVGEPGFVGSSRVMPDFAVGIIGEWGIFYGGIAAHHLIQPTEARYGEYEARVPRKYTAHLGCDINLYRRYIIRKGFILSPNIIYQQQSDFKQLNIGAYLSHQNIVAGLWVRNSIGLASNTFVFITGYHDINYSFAYSYDFSVLRGGFRGLNTSSHEVTFGMNFEYKKRLKKRISTIKSPKF